MKITILVLMSSHTAGDSRFPWSAMTMCGVTRTRNKKAGSFSLDFVIRSLYFTNDRVSAVYVDVIHLVVYWLPDL